MEEIEAILPRARELFRKFGYRGTTLRTLKKELDLSERDLYNLVGGKKELLKEVIRRESDLWNAWFQQASEASHGQPKEILKNLMAVILQELKSDQIPCGTLLGNIAGELTEEDRDIQELIAEQYDLIGKMIANALRSGNHVSHPGAERRMSLFLLATLEGSALLAKTDRDFWELENGLEMARQTLER